jgi:hypothetical protein
MVEHDCSNHLKRLRVTLDPAKLIGKQRSNLIAALLRQLADYTDGFCATQLADDEDLKPGKSISFWFTTDSKRQEFDNRIACYLRADINAALTRTKG